jgi:hypothetical protein
MRIWGTVLVVLGILFLILFVFAELGGGHVGYVPFFVSFFLTLLGWNLRTSGKGILQSNPVNPPSGTASTQGGLSAAAAPEFSTMELPLTPEIAALIARQIAGSRRILLYIVAGCLILFGGLGAVLSLTDKTPGGNFTFLAIFGSIGVITAILIYGISWLTTIKPVRRDLRGTTYLRTTGPVKIVPMSGGAMLRLADRAFLMNGRNGAAELSQLNWGRVDYSPHGHVILGAWDKDGRSVYSLPEYNAGQ